jgi:flagellar protein FlaI
MSGIFCPIEEGNALIVQIRIRSFFSRGKKEEPPKNPVPDPLAPLPAPEPEPKKDKPDSPDRIKKPSRRIITALSEKTKKGMILFTLVAAGATATGGVVLFIDMPLILMAVLSAISLILLVLFVIAAQERFHLKKAPAGSPGPAIDQPVRQPVLKSPPKAIARKNGFGDFKATLYNVPRTLGGRTDKGDALILAVCIIAILTAYVSLFIDLPLLLLIVLGIVSAASFALAAFSAAFRFAPAKMNALIPYLSSSGTSADTKSPLPDTTKEQDISTDAMQPADLENTSLPEKPAGPIRDVYWVEAPYVYIKIVRQGNLGFVYTVVEPEITTREKIVLQETYNYLRDVIIFDNPEKNPTDQLKRENIYRILKEYDPTTIDERFPILYYYLKRDLTGFGLLEPLMHDPGLEDISCNGENLPVFVFHRSYGSLPTSVLFHKGELNQYVLKLAQKANKQISLSNPMVDATLPDGSRVQVTYSNVISTNGSSFTIRKFRAEPMTPLDLIKYGTYNAEILAFLWLVIEHRRSLIIAGGTASGKTSTMNAISLFIPLNSKIVSLEDTREIQLPHKNWLATQTRELNTPGMIGDIDLFALLKSSMRQRPEYIIVGEVRGAEAQTLFQAMNTGHATLSTIHAGSVQEAVNRLTHEPINVPPVMFTALDLVVNQSVFTYGNNRVRRCFAINEILVDSEGNIIPTKLYEWDISQDKFIKVASQSKVLKEIAILRNWTMDQLIEELKKREEFLKVAVDVPTPDIIDLANAIHELGE